MTDVELREREIQIWWTSLDVDKDQLEQLRSLLSPQEKQRAGRFRIGRAERRFVAARAALRIVLGQCTGIDPASITFGFGDHGKPYLGSGGPLFNASDSGDVVAIAVTTAEVGIDIETNRTLRRADGLARRVCTRLELDALAKISEDERNGRILRLWTCKEAGLKAVGVGLPGGARNVEIAFSKTGSPALTNLLGETSGWTLLFPDIDPDIVCSLVVQGDHWRAVNRPFSIQST
jgi:4'-phosphopantetheinyl transferase